MKIFCALLLFVSLACGTALAAGAKFSAPSKAKVGDTITARGSGLKNGGKYSLRLIFEGQPSEGQPITCAAKLGKRHRAAGGQVKISGKIPGRMPCYQGNGESLGTIAVMPGKYHLLLAVPAGPTGSSGKYSFVRRKLTIRKG